MSERAAWEATINRFVVDAEQRLARLEADLADLRDLLAALDASFIVHQDGELAHGAVGPRTKRLERRLAGVAGDVHDLERRIGCGGAPAR
jgi:hypothetical protein